MDADEDVPQADDCCICTETITFRGSIDSCRHPFCFDCISRWSQIESKCPVCRTRFKLLNDVEVPERDQRGLVEDPAFVDWLESVRCVVCAGADDEDRLLLCDGCDQASHTYCVGLASVPDDAWYCHQCSLPVDTDSPLLVHGHRRGRGRGRRRLRRIESDTETDAETIVDSLESDVEEIPATSIPRQRPPRTLLFEDTDDGDVVDLTSPDPSLRGSNISPPVIDLRSRLRSQLLNGGSEQSLGANRASIAQRGAEPDVAVRRRDDGLRSDLCEAGRDRSARGHTDAATG